MFEPVLRAGRHEKFKHRQNDDGNDDIVAHTTLRLTQSLIQSLEGYTMYGVTLSENSILLVARTKE